VLATLECALQERLQERIIEAVCFEWIEEEPYEVRVSDFLPYYSHRLEEVELTEKVFKPLKITVTDHESFEQPSVVGRHHRATALEIIAVGFRADEETIPEALREVRGVRYGVHSRSRPPTSSTGARSSSSR
jgi:hypothetical protein